MPPRPSEPLLQLLRDTAKKKGLNTAALAAVAGIERARLKHVLAGSEALTVDELIGLSKALELDAAAVTGAPVDEAEPEPAEEPAPAFGRGQMRAISRRDAENTLHIDPLGNHTEQALRLGFGLGCDMFIHLQADKLGNSGIPRDTLARFPAEVPLRLDAAYHRHHDPRFLPQGLQLVLSFDALYTCLVPWDAFLRVTYLPLPPEPEEPEDDDDEQGGDDNDAPADAGARRRGHLRLV